MRNAIVRVGDTGFEPPAPNPGKTATLGQGGAESGALSALQDQIGTDLRLIIEAWPDLHEATKEDDMAIIRTACESPHHRLRLRNFL